MPEEINRRRHRPAVATCCSSPAPTRSGTWPGEGVPADRIHFVGNPMIDTLLEHLDRFDAAALPGRGYGLSGDYLVATAAPAGQRRRPGGAAARLVTVLTRRPASVRRWCCRCTRAAGRHCETAGLLRRARVRGRTRCRYIDFLGLVRAAAAVVTDSGGVQEETTVLGVPCLTHAAQHRAPGHHHPRHQPAGRRRRRCSPLLERGAGRGRPGRPARRIGARLSGTGRPGRGSPRSILELAGGRP